MCLLFELYNCEYKMLEKILTNLWYKDIEIKIFLSAASIWASPASLIAKKTWIKRTTCYTMLEWLCQKNIMRRIIKSWMRYYEAIWIEELSDFLKWNIDWLLTDFKELERNKTELQKLYVKNIWDTKISFFEWFDDIKQAYDGLLREQDDEIYSLVNRDFNIKNHPLKEYWDKYYYKRLELKKMSYTVSNSTDNTKPKIESNDKKLRKSLVLPEEILPVFWDVKVTGDNLVLISQNEGRIFWISIKNKWFANMFKKLIKELWKKYE